MCKYIINNIGFETKKDIIKHIQSILYKYDVGNIINKGDLAFLYDLLQRHHRPDDKIGCGVKAMRVMTTKFNTNGFEIIRKDNTVADFSFMKCVNKKSELHDIKDACRNAVSEDIIQFKQEQFKKNANEKKEIICPLTGGFITWDNSHVDHVPPNTFDNIFKKWLKEQDIDPKSVELLGYADGEVGKWFKDKNIGKKFREFHNKHAKLRTTSAIGNLSHSKKEKHNL